VRLLTKADLLNLQSLVLAGTGFSSEVLTAIIRKQDDVDYLKDWEYGH